MKRHDESIMDKTSSYDGLPITVIVATRNEEANIDGCLMSLTRARHVMVADSQSTDRTREIAKQRGAEVFSFSYAGGYPKKRQWALNVLPISTPWTMLIDADEQLTPQLWNEIEGKLNSGGLCTAYLVRKEFHFLGKKFRFGGFSFSTILLFRTGSARFEEMAGNCANGQDMEVHERLIVDGTVGRLRSPLLHDDHKGLLAYIEKHNRYSTWEAAIRHHYIETGSWGQQTIKGSLLGDAQNLRRLFKAIILRFPCESWVWFLYHYIVCGGILEGRRGYIAASLRRAYIEQVHFKLYEQQSRELSLPASKRLRDIIASGPQAISPDLVILDSNDKHSPA
jgi:glycosyltransferase involved in cell wall biosynthesis